MNATETLVRDAITNTGSHTVATLVNETGKSETTVRKALKSLVEQGEARVVETDGKREYFTDELVAEDAPKKRYRRHDTPTTRTTRTNQITKCEVAVVRTDEDEATAKQHNVTAKWMTVCHTHDHAVGSEKVLDAHWFSSYPLFCKETRKQVQAAVGRRRQNKNTFPEAAAKWLPTTK